ncbi:lytic transglycosylase domain-containing protein [Alteromonas antoniana]|uniref:lytic transglycosylase domain-containing protein n=1 Tax=Alteromonas antoniana TaxID=2803813 RepID=UPI001C4577A1|nr:lytic transglycosylase domain-containing protein [Alteromonas antoniana]
MSALIFVKPLSPFSVILFLLFSSCSLAEVDTSGSLREAIYSELERARPIAKYKHCVTAASTTFEVNELILLSVLMWESGYMNPLRKNNDGTFDHGFAQINTVRETEIMQIGYTLDDMITSPCKNIMAAAFLLSREIKEAGDVWKGAANYHYDEGGDYPHNHHAYKRHVFAQYLSILTVAQRNN